MKALMYHENKRRGSADFPLEYHDIDQRHSRYEMPYHWHEEMEILHVLEGSFHLTLEEETLLMQAGDIAVISSGCLHGGMPEQCHYECVVFDLRMLLKCDDEGRRFIAAVMNGHAAIRPLFSFMDAVAAHTLHPMFEALRTQIKGSALVSLGALYQFFGQVYACRAFAQKAPGYTREARQVLKLKKVFEIIESEYQNPPTLEKLAGSVGLSTKYFCRFFKNATHFTPMDYITYYRMEMACYEMAATEKNMTEIAMALGYHDLNYFVRCFKKHKGMTPKQYQMSLKGD